MGRSSLFDGSVAFIEDNALKDALFISVFWWYWFRKADAVTMARTRVHVLATLCVGMGVIVAARILALTLPFRVRPRFDPALHFVVPGHQGGVLINWSSFPSYHAVMFSALATGLCFISWRIGLAAFFYSILLIDMPRNTWVFIIQPISQLDWHWAQ